MLNVFLLALVCFVSNSLKPPNLQKIQSSVTLAPSAVTIILLDLHSTTQRGVICVSECLVASEKRVFIFYCLICFSFSMWWQSLSAGPSFSPMYFIMTSLRNSIRALPSISCFLNSSTCGPSVWGSASWTNRITSSTDQEDASFPEPSLSCFKWSGPVVELAASTRLCVHTGPSSVGLELTRRRVGGVCVSPG